MIGLGQPVQGPLWRHSLPSWVTCNFAPTVVCVPVYVCACVCVCMCVRVYVRACVCVFSYFVFSLVFLNLCFFFSFIRLSKLPKYGKKTKGKVENIISSWLTRYIDLLPYCNSLASSTCSLHPSLLLHSGQVSPLISPKDRGWDGPCSPLTAQIIHYLFIYAMQLVGS